MSRSSIGLICGAALCLAAFVGSFFEPDGGTNSSLVFFVGILVMVLTS